MITPRPSLASQRWVQHGPGEPVTFSHSRVLSVKRADGEYLSREDVQFDFLSAIFSSDVKAFTNQAPNTPKDSPKVTFAELYIGSIINSSKCSKSQRENLVQNPDFAIDYCKVCLLVNVGRINTTFAFYPEMKTQLRTYHPIPCFQRSAIAKKCMQDSPRMKSTMKGCLLVHERRNIPLAPQELLLKAEFNHTPTTSIVNLLFILAGHSASISRTHFEGLEFLDLFLPINIPSQARSRAFLWVVYHYLENPKENPFDDDFSRANPGRVPLLPRFATPDDMAVENIDTQEELEWGTKMGQWRRQYQQTMAQQAAVEDWTEGTPQAPQRPAQTTPPEPIARSAPINPPTSTHPAPRSSHQKPRGSFARSTQPQSFAAARHFSLLHRAVVVGGAIDPLYDSDEEDGDETRMDLERRLSVLQTYYGPVS